MKHILLLILPLALLAGCSNTSGEDNSEMAKQLVLDSIKIMKYIDGEIEIEFPGSFIVSDKESFAATKNKSYTNGYFLAFEKAIRFHEDDQEYYYKDEKTGRQIPLQAAVTDDGYLSTLYIYPTIDQTALLKEIETAFKPDGSNMNMTYRNVKKRTINKLNLLNWRTQHYKSGFEYYLLLGKTKNYLFISPPFGEIKHIEKLLLSVKFTD